MSRIRSSVDGELSFSEEHHSLWHRASSSPPVSELAKREWATQKQASGQPCGADLPDHLLTSFDERVAAMSHASQTPPTKQTRPGSGSNSAKAKKKHVKGAGEKAYSELGVAERISRAQVCFEGSDSL